MGALGIHIDDNINAETVGVAHEPPIIERESSESDASSGSSDHEPVVSASEALRCCVQLHSYFITHDHDPAPEQASLGKLMGCVRQRKAHTARQRNLEFSDFER